MTNADRIRAMTDEELVVVLGDMGHDYPPYCQGKVMEEFCGKIDYDCRICCRDWLKKEADNG